VASFEATWQENMKQMQLHYGLLEPYVSLRKVLFQVLNRHDYLPRHLLEFATLARKVCCSLFPILSFFLLVFFFFIPVNGKFGVDEECRLCTSTWLQKFKTVVEYAIVMWNF